MTCRARALFVLGLLLASAMPAAAQIGGHPLEISGGAGIFTYDARVRTKDGPAWIGALGWRASSFLTLEGNAAFGPAERDFPPLGDQNFSFGGLDLRWNLVSAEERALPFVLTGFGYAASHDEGLSPAKLERGAPKLGLGFLWNAYDQRTFLRLQVQDVFFRERDALEFSHHIAATAGVQFVWGGKERDNDLDKVRNWLDRCPDTPIGCTVDASGCPVDSDRDSICDGIDTCPNTPVGCVVDKTGCPIDADGDGVCDGLDKCPDTPKGVSVDLNGCPNDDDNDKVPNDRDECPNTPTACTVDEKGCPIDTDKDGVCDALDKCPETAAGLKVDAEGCPIEVIERETELMDTGMIRLQNIHFETAKWDILPDERPRIDVVGQVLTRWPELKIEIGGHTDARGTNAYNHRLSHNRANAVRDYLLKNFPALKPDQYTAVGYGEDQPIAPNNGEPNWGRNRRVEFVVKNRDVLRREIERRRLLRKGEDVPKPPALPVPVAPSPGSSPADSVSLPSPTPAPPDTTTPR